MLKASGIKKFEDLKAELLEIAARDLGAGRRSEYSTAMMKDAIGIVDLFLQNNEVSYLKNSNFLDELKKCLKTLDNGKETGAPEVFNEESELLAKAVDAFLQKFSLDEDLQPESYPIINGLFKKVADTIVVMSENTQGNLKFYEMVSLSIKNVQESQQFHKKLQLRSKFYETRSEKVGTQDYATFKLQYESEMQSFIDLIQKFQYLRITFNNPCVSAELPWKIQSNDVNFQLDRVKMITQLLDIEMKINMMLLSKKLNCINFVFEYYKKICIDSRKKYIEVESLIQGFEATLINYQNPKRFSGFRGLFKSVNSEKIKILKNLLEQLKEYVKQADPKAISCKSLAEVSFEIFMIAFDAAKENEEISRAKGISLGECAVLINDFRLEILAFFCGINEKNDTAIFAKLNEYKEEISRIDTTITPFFS